MADPGDPVDGHDRARLLASDRLEAARFELQDIKDQLSRAPRWRPGRGLTAQCDEALRLITTMKQRMQRKLVVAIVGPTGAGKSTLLNALAGVDDLSSSSTTRPTTRDVVVFCRDRDDATPIVEALGHDQVAITSSPAAAALTNVVLVDTPDINSAHLAQHRPLVEGVIGLADVLLCVFNVENPKTRDNADFLAPFVAGFPGQFVLAVLNHCDRQDERELRSDIQPDFKRYLATSWSRPARQVFCISARRHLRRPQWPTGAEPRHDFDEFGRLREMLFGSLNQANVVMDARIARARHLVKSVRAAVIRVVDPIKPTLEEAKRRIRQLHNKAMSEATGALGHSNPSLSSGTDALLYQRLANAWWGPVGWLVGLWARLLIVGTGFANMMRLGRPLRQLWGVVTSLAKFRQSQSQIADTEAGTGVDAAGLRYRQTVETGWPDLAETLVKCGFEPGVRDASSVVPPSEALGEAFGRGWNQALATELDRTTGRLSSWGLQLFLNAWVFVPAGYVAVESVANFAQRQLLSGDYFRHAFFTIFILWLLAFMLLQMAARASGGRRLIKATFKRLLVALNEPGDDKTLQASLVEELETVRRLGSL